MVSRAQSRGGPSPAPSAVVTRTPSGAARGGQAGLRPQHRAATMAGVVRRPQVYDVGADLPLELAVASPCATTRPRSITTIRSQRSASSMW